MQGRSVFDVDALLEQECWVRRLARALVCDQDEADEVVQEARVAWWRRSPRDVGQARSWLGTVVRNAVRGRRRTQQRRLDLLGRAGPQPGATPSAEGWRSSSRSIASWPGLWRSWRSRFVRWCSSATSRG
jgi:DNA-directed RNA polymerase specialized sigma24 family protein